MNIRPTNFRTLDLNLLKVFDVVMAERNVTRAAARLAMTQPAVSNALRRLRESTHEDLFVSTSTGMTPTPHAQTLWPTVRASLDGLQRAHGRVDLRVVPLTSRDPRPMLEHGQADVAVGFFPDANAALEAEGDDSVIRRDRLYECAYVCVMRRGHPLAIDGALTLDAYCASDHLRVSFAGRPRGFVDEALARLGRERRVLITVNQFSSAGSVVRASDLLAVLPRSFVPATGFEAELAVRELPFELPGIDVSMLWHRRHEQDTAQRWLRDMVARTAARIANGLPVPPLPQR